MFFENMIVPGWDWVEIVSVRNKDGSPLEEENWRRNYFGMITRCWIAGGFLKRGAFFRGDIRMINGDVFVVSLHKYSWCSTTEAHPVEVKPDVYDLGSNTSIYRFRILTEDEISKVHAAVDRQLRAEKIALQKSLNTMKETDTSGK